jgi:ATP-dependent RNA helicase DDX10/DBP4
MPPRRSRDQRREDTQRNIAAFESELESINDRLNELASRGCVPATPFEDFASLPLFESTKESLARNKFVKLSPIQQQSLPYSLCGRDVIGAAETGTGKTLAFVIPVIELLKKNKWNARSGIGALIISPTRDLAAQTYRVVASLIENENISCGLVTGGLNFEQEQAGLQRLNIIIATVGRLKEHMDNSPTFDASGLQILVLDEADRLLGSEFLKDLKQMIRELPVNRQTLLFTATANKAIRELSKISLKHPVRVLMTESRESATPDHLIQFYSIVPLSQKFNTLFSFLKNHKSDKIIVFLSTIKMVRFVFEAFRHLKPGIPLMHLTGKQSSELRFSVCQDFVNKDRAVIFTTDVAARGLDFPQVNWVVQLDCPVTTDTYIHRVGRTARFFQGGKALLFVTPAETAIIDRLAANKVVVQPIQIQSSELVDIRPELVEILARFTDVKHLAIKAFATYVKNVQKHGDGEVFNLEAVLAEKDEFARSFGLLGTPVITRGSKSAEEQQLPAVEEAPFYRIVEDDGEDFGAKRAHPALRPERLQFLEPDTEITEEEYKAWRAHLRGLLADDVKPKAVKKQDKKEPALSLEDAAEQMLLEQFG